MLMISNIVFHYFLERRMAKSEKHENELDFKNGWDLSDVRFKFDNEEIVHANRYVLCQWSPVFKTMLTTQHFKEKNQEIIDFPEKNVSDFLKLMEVLHIPPKPITGKNKLI